LFSKGSSLTGQGQAFYAAGQAYGVDPAFIVAITGAESSFGVLLYHSGADYATYNAWNWFYADPRSASDFVSWGEGATRVARGLAGGLYYGAGRYGVLDIAPVYCPEGTQNWVNNVTFFMIEMGADPADTRWAGATGAAAVPVASAQTRTRPTLALDGKVVVTAPRHSDGVLVAAFAVRNVGKRAGGWESVTLVLRRLKSRSEINVGPATPLTLAPDKGTTYRVTSTIPRAGTWTGTIWVRTGGRWWVLGRDPLFKVKVAARR
ncbi:MAG TPA: hypothetical protein VJ787_04165, partial [Thermoleophilia bacterium]|nr:hypothetical protein [Thermoleophilia bacterium]